MARRTLHRAFFAGSAVVGAELAHIGASIFIGDPACWAGIEALVLEKEFVDWDASRRHLAAEAHVRVRSASLARI